MHTISADIAATPNTPFPWDKLIAGIYFLGVAVMSIRLLNAIREIQWIRRSGQHTLIDGQRCVRSAKVKSPFSYLSTIYFPMHHQFGDTELKEVVAHELAHVKGRHTMDVLFMEAACILFWPSPLIYLYRKALRDVHEFVADAAVIRDTPWEHYAELLVGQQQGQLQNILSNQLIYSQLKKRLLMMNQERSGFAARFKYLGIIPVVLVALVLFSFREKQTDAMPINPGMISGKMNDEVILYVTNSQRYFLGTEEINREELSSALSEIMQGVDDRTLKLLLDQSVTVGDLSEVLDAAFKLNINLTLDTAKGYDLYKSGLKTTFSSNTATGVSWSHSPGATQALPGISDTLPTHMW
jgi:biopolymer transport protein ExbD